MFIKQHQHGILLACIPCYWESIIFVYVEDQSHGSAARPYHTIGVPIANGRKDQVPMTFPMLCCEAH